MPIAAPSAADLELASLRQRLLGREGKELMDCLRFAPRAADGSLNYALFGPRDRQPRHAAVMLLFLPDADGLTVLLTERQSDLRDHAGEIAFPGGRIEAGESALEAALREVEEEIGLPQSAIEVWGGLDGVYVPPSNFLVTPFTGLVLDVSSMRLDQREVASLLRIPLPYLFQPEAVGTRLDDRGRQVEHYVWQQHRVWGGTARMLNNLCEALGEPCEPWHRERSPLPPGEG